MTTFNHLRLPPSDRVEVLSVDFYGDLFSENAKLRRLLGESHDGLGIQRVRVDGIEGRIYFITFEDAQRATRAGKRVGSTAGLPFKVIYGADYLTFYESGELDSFHAAVESTRFDGREIWYTEPPPLSDPSGVELIPALAEDFEAPDPDELAIKVFTEFWVDIEELCANESELEFLDRKRSQVRRFVPEPLSQDEVVGSVITGWTSAAGTYGMGGPGFVGFELDGEQWLVIALWGAEEWLEMDGRVLSQYPKEALDESFVGSRITAVGLERDSFWLELDRGQRVEVSSSIGARAAYPGSGEPRVLSRLDDLRKGVFCSPTIGLWLPTCFG